MMRQSNNSSKIPKGFKYIMMAGVFIIIASALSWLIMILWNNILSETTGVKPLNFWKAAGILLLAKILFGGLKRHRKSGHSSKKHRWKHKWMEMSREERQEARSRWKEHCKKRGEKDI